MTVLLVIIYLAFISLGLPDPLLGSAWPAIQIDLGASFGALGFISMTVSACTVISSLLSGRVVARFGPGKVTLFSVLLTVVALFGFYFSPSVGWLVMMAIPLGLGAGSVDAVLNNFVALHYESKHMSWLHCFWGIGATAGPIIMSGFLMGQGGWRMGYLTIALIQTGLVAVLFTTLNFWGAASTKNKDEEENPFKFMTNTQILKTPYLHLALISFMFYSATEITVGVWSSSYLVSVKGLPTSTAARWVAYFYAGITVGRFLSGLFSMKFKNHTLIRAGQIICLIGVAFLALPLPIYFSMLGLIIIGLGAAPIFPCMIHETPNRFGKVASQSVIGFQMAFAYTGSAFAPLAFEFMSSFTGVALLPYFILICILTMFFSSELIHNKIGKFNHC